MSKKNAELKAKYIDNISEDGEDSEKSETLRGRVSDTALTKAKKHDFYLGLESTWLYK